MNKAQRTRQFIIEQSAPLFNTKGVAGTSMSDIMDVTKMAKGGLYGHFESKEDLSYAVVDHCLRTLAEKLKIVTNPVKSAKDSLLAYLDFFNNPVQFHIEGGCPMLNFGTETDDTNPIIQKMVKQSIESMENKIVGMIEQGIAAGEFNAGWNAKEFAIKMFAMIEGATMICRVVGNNNQMKTIIKLLKQEINEQGR